MEQRGSIENKKVVWLGDGNNMCHSYMNAARICNFQLTVACPEGFEPNSDIMKSNKEFVTMEREPTKAVKNADLIVTDVWARKKSRMNVCKSSQNSRLILI